MFSSIIKKIIKFFLITLAFTFLAFIILSFTSLPYLAYRNLGQIKSSLTQNPEAIIVYSAAGMPDPHTLMRIYTVAIYAIKYPNAKLFIAYPIKSQYDSTSVSLLCNELEIKGIAKSRMYFEPHGKNTYEQTKNICKQLLTHDIHNIQVISSPEHLYRAVACFRKQGITNIGSTAAVEQVIAPESLKGESIEPLEVESLLLRYNIWSYMKYEITVLREYIAIVYYKSKGWI